MAAPRPRPSVEGRESPSLVALAGIAILALAVPAIGYLIGLGDVAVALAGLGLLALAWLLPTTRDARILRVIVALLGAAALAVALLSLAG